MSLPSAGGLATGLCKVNQAPWHRARVKHVSIAFSCVFIQVLHRPPPTCSSLQCFRDICRAPITKSTVLSMLVRLSSTLATMTEGHASCTTPVAILTLQVICATCKTYLSIPILQRHLGGALLLFADLPQQLVPHTLFSKRSVLVWLWFDQRRRRCNLFGATCSITWVAYLPVFKRGKFKYVAAVLSYSLASPSSPAQRRRGCFQWRLVDAKSLRLTGATPGRLLAPGSDTGVLPGVIPLEITADCSVRQGQLVFSMQHWTSYLDHMLFVAVILPVASSGQFMVISQLTYVVALHVACRSFGT